MVLGKAASAKRGSVVLGIDAAWTLTQPSGVALVARRGAAWRLIAAAGSYDEFQVVCEGLQAAQASSHQPNASTLLTCAETMAGAPVSLIAVDMPLANTPITGRRTSDDAVSRAFGSMACGTHTPSAERPGPISNRLTADFAELGYCIIPTLVPTHMNRVRSTSLG